MHPVYLDHNATTPIRAEARAAMDPYLQGQYGNPLTAHRFGAGPRAAVESSRGQVAALVGLADRPGECEVLFNSGGTEGLNHAVKGLAFRSLANGTASHRRRIVLGAIEHYAVWNSARWLASRFGFEVVEVAPGRDGVVPVDALVEAIDGKTTLLVALQWANNEVGSLQPVREVGRLCRELGIPLVCDAVQGGGKVDLTGALAFTDCLAFSAHKMYGPKGVGALVLRSGLDFDTLIHGAPQEAGRRGGTHNVPGIVGFAAAVRAALADLPKEAARLSGLRDLLWSLLRERVEGVEWNGKAAPLLPNTLNVSFEGCSSQALCEEMDRRGFAVSPGAACRSGDVKPSRTLLAMGLSESRALSSVRVSLGHDTTRHDILAAAEAFAEAARRVRADQ